MRGVDDAILDCEGVKAHIFPDWETDKGNQATFTETAEYLAILDLHLTVKR